MDRISADVVAPQSSAAGPATRLKARVIIPVWGAKYVQRLGRGCLPALLAPGNLPHLAKHFDCELVIVTQAGLFDMVRAMPAIQIAGRHAELKLVAMDDVLSHPNYYGYTITHALYRGFSDLGEKAMDTWCLFLNADFILADGSYRALVERMQQGERCILAPSYCTIEENVRPAIETRIAANGGVLDLPAREMAGLILDNRHFSIRSKIINSQMYRIDRVDQFYYVVDNDTMLGRQMPIAVVALRPEVPPREPVAFWDYGVISEICPSGRLCVLGDSDDFLIMELRAHSSMSEQLQLGRMDKEEIASDLTIWTTRDQRACGEFDLILHRAALPPGLSEGLRALGDYYRDVMSRVSPEPRDHRNHYIWSGMLDLHDNWLNAHAQSAAQATGAVPPPPEKASFAGMVGKLAKELAMLPFTSVDSRFRHVSDVMRTFYRRLFGRVPDVGLLHPYRVDMDLACGKIRDAARSAKSALAVWSMSGAVVAPHLSRWIKTTASCRVEELLGGGPPAEIREQAPFDFCFVELSKDEIYQFRVIHARLRELVRKNGRVVLFFRTGGREGVNARDFKLISEGLPDRDLATMEVRGDFLACYLQASWDRHWNRISRGKVSELIRFAAWASLIGPLAWFSNRRAGRWDGRMPQHITSLCVDITVL